jgi:hypothetical protein
VDIQRRNDAKPCETETEERPPIHERVETSCAVWTTNTKTNPDAVNPTGERARFRAA